MTLGLSQMQRHLWEAQSYALWPYLKIKMLLAYPTPVLCQVVDKRLTKRAVSVPNLPNKQESGERTGKEKEQHTIVGDLPDWQDKWQYLLIFLYIAWTKQFGCFYFAIGI